MNKHFTLVDYDVWGNEVDGWEVNTAYRTDIKLPHKDYEDADIVKALIALNYLGKNVKPSDIYVEWLDDTMVELSSAKNYCPICKLELEKE